jgi:dTDP-4-dehydrorhamnose 3,5-epimerase
MSARFDLRATPLEGLVVLERRPAGDERGRLERMFCAAELAPFLGGAAVAQSNLTWTAKRGAVRGMHLQAPPHVEDKLVTCLRGRVWDVAVDLREGSPTFLRWHAEVLDGAGHRSLLIPRGFAHGFQALTDDCTMLYFHTAPHAPAAELGLDALDPRLGIAWPEPVACRSARDQAHPPIDASYRGVRP